MAGSIFDGFNLTDTLNKFKTSTDQAMSKVKDSTLTPMDVTGDRMKEGAALLKPTDTSVTKTIGTYKSTAVSELDGIIGMLSGGLLNTKDLTGAIRMGPNGLGLSTDAILAAASTQAGFPISSAASGMRRLASGITTEFRKLTGIDVGGLVTSDGKSFGVSGNWRTYLGQATLDQINSLTGINDFIDVSMQTALYNSVMQSAAQLGMKDSYKSIYDLYQNQRSARDILIDAIRTMITNGDIESIDEVVKLMDQDGINSINAIYPDFIETLFRSFHFAEDVYVDQYGALREKLLGFLVKICGPNWWMRSTQFGNAYNMAVINSASTDMITLLSGMDELAPLLCSAGMFNEGNAITMLKQQFRDAPVYHV